VGNELVNLFRSSEGVKRGANVIRVYKLLAFIMKTTPPMQSRPKTNKQTV
jgi:hypothetical protein